MVESSLKMQLFRHKKRRNNPPQVFFKLHTMIAWQIYRRTPMSKCDFKKVTNGPKLGPKLGYFLFSQLWLFRFTFNCTVCQPGIISNCQQRSNLRKNFGAQISVKWPKIGAKIRFFAIFSSLDHQFSLKSTRMIAQNNVQLLVVVKLTKKNINGRKFGSRGSNVGPKLGFLPFYQVWFISFPLNCT